jgi:hypothetical protein
MDIKRVNPFRAAFLFKLLYSINLQFLLTVEFLMAMTIKIIVFWDVEPDNLTYYITNILKKPATSIFETGSSETLVPI